MLPLLDESDEPMDDENLIDYGLDSVRMMALAARWRKVHGDIDFVVLAKNPTIDAWWALLFPRGEIMNGLDFHGRTVCGSPARARGSATPPPWRSLRPARR
ncbi:isochorismatase [Klebsiella michiganensis]|uniref:Isochorismatase n=1 Tax=Klebsiella michiganensis TaxID=1134687 RepID=A0A7H4N4Z9_9ENTR|nr:isochorismatase [Klebsiella michiganensis]